MTDPTYYRTRQMNGEPFDDGIPQTPLNTPPPVYEADQDRYEEGFDDGYEEAMDEFDSIVPEEEPTLREDFLARLTSRKFLTWAATTLALVTLVVMGRITPEAFMAFMTAAGVGYQVSEGLADSGNRS